MTTRRNFMSQSAAAASALAFPLVAGAQPRPIKIGVLHPVTGALAYSGQQCRLGAMLAIEDINKAGGIKSLGGAKIEALLADNRPDEALTVVNGEVSVTTQDPQLYQYQARTYALLGKRLAQHRAQAEAYVLDALWARLPAGTRLVANAVTLESEALLARWHGQTGGSLLRIELADAAPLGSRHGWRARYPVVQWSAVL